MKPVALAGLRAEVSIPSSADIQAMSEWHDIQGRVVLALETSLRLRFSNGEEHWWSAGPGHSTWAPPIESVADRLEGQVRSSADDIVQDAVLQGYDGPMDTKGLEIDWRWSPQALAALAVAGMAP